MRFSLLCTMMLGLVICGQMVSGCIDKISENITQKPVSVIPDPETGIAAWISAINDRDYGSIYDLMPRSERSGISRAQFIRFNQESPSPFIASGPQVTDFFILDRQVDGLNATLVAGLRTIHAISGVNNSPVNDVVFFTFDEKFEENEWKVWTR